MTREQFESSNLGFRFKKGDDGFRSGWYHERTFDKDINLKDMYYKVADVWGLADIATNRDKKWSGEIENVFIKKWKKAKNFNDFLESLLEEDTIGKKYTDLLWGAKDPDFYDRKLFYSVVEHSFATWLRVNVHSKDFMFEVGGGHGDWVTVGIIDNNPDLSLPLSIATCVRGKFRIDGYAPEGKEYLEGDYIIYTMTDYVIFQKIK